VSALRRPDASAPAAPSRNQRRREAVRHYEATFLGDERHGKTAWYGKIETIGEFAIIGPLAVGTEIGDRALDLDDDQIAAAPQRENIRAAAVGEREFEQAGVAELLERAADTASEKRRREGFAGRHCVGRIAEIGHHGAARERDMTA
jgi:hypothetical protein